MTEENNRPCQALINVRGHLRIAEYRLKRLQETVERESHRLAVYEHSWGEASAMDVGGIARRLRTALAESEGDG